MAQCGILVDSLTQFTADLVKFAAAETRYHEFLSRGGGGSSGGGDGGCPSEPGGGVVVVPSIKPSIPKTITPAVAKTCNGHVDVVEGGNTCGLSALSQQIANARLEIASSLLRSSKPSSSSPCSGGVLPSEDDAMIREENLRLKQQLEVLQAQVNKLTDRVSRLETRLTDGTSGGGGGDSAKKPSAPAPKDGEDDVDLFGSDEEEDEEAAKIKESRLAEYAAKKSAKPGVIAKSNVILDVKPWDDETDMKELEKAVRTIVMDGLLWGVSKLVPVGYGIMKLQIATVVEDEKVSIDDLVEKIQEFEDFVQSVDIAAFNKI